ncbi:hypothetical protein ACFU44_18440 [Nocardia rhizosphaerihabitans]|uniref:hypothetical protein n=1 Tax=Nocardia rhizosphaerihabitans TaxID=1691570 RepID=UPI00366DE9EE
MSERTFIRRFKAEVGTTPRAWLDAQRLGRPRSGAVPVSVPFSGRWAVLSRASELGVSRSFPSRTISPARFWVYLSMSEGR